MPRRCSVFGCKSNYDSETETTSTFSLPADENRRKIWLRHIPTDFSKLKNPVVCIKHFDESFIVRVDRFVVNGDIKEFPRIRPKLSENAVPTIFPNTPSYCSKSVPKVKRLGDVEEENLQQAIQDSIESHKEYLTCDTVNSVYDITLFLESHKIYSSKWTVVKDDKKLHICLLNIINGEPCITSYITVCDDLNFSVTVKNICVSNDSISETKLLKSLSFLHNIMLQLEKGEIVATVKHKLDYTTQLIQSFPNYNDSENLKFIVEQLTLSQIPKNNRQYGNRTMILASSLYVHSVSAYNALRKCNLMYFPHPRTLQKLMCNYQLSNTSLESSPYLENRVKHLKQHELLVSLLLDEIYIQPQLSFKCGQIYGSSNFDAHTCAKTAQVFMVSSVLSKYVDVVAIIPVANMTSEQLKSLISDVLCMLEKTGFKVISLIADNNSVNRKAYELFTANKILQPSIDHPLDPSRKLFFLFDTVHILKCIRNNWETKRNINKSLQFPDMNDHSVILSAQYRHLELIFEKEKDSLVKYGHTLSAKVLYPSSIQKQNVNLALRIFNDNNTVALKHVTKDLPDVTQQINQTTIFLSIIVRWWKTVNVKSVFEGKRFNDPYREAIKSTSDSQVQFLSEMCQWLKMWRVSVSSCDALSSQTFQSLITTLEAFLQLIPYLFEKYKIDYILLGKFQSDNLEGRFGSYRQLSGANYYISYMQILENERKLRFKNDVLFASQIGNVRLKSLIPIQQALDSEVDIQIFSEILDVDFEMDVIPSNIVPILTYLGGFAARQTLRKSKCDECSTWLQLNKEVEVDSSYNFVKDLDRGKLILPTGVVVFTVGVVWHTVSLLLKDFIQYFLTCRNQLSISHKLSVIQLRKSDVKNIECKCSVKNRLIEKLESVSLCVNKILINNYVNMSNDKACESKATSRKVKKLKT